MIYVIFVKYIIGSQLSVYNMQTPETKEKLSRTIDLPDDDFKLVIQPPKETAQKKAYIDTIQFKKDQDSMESIALYVSINRDYLENLISRKQIAVKEFQKSQIAGKELIYKKDFKTKYFQFTFNIYELQRIGIIFETVITNKETQKAWIYTNWRLHYKDLANWRTQNNSSVDEHQQKQVRISWKIEEIYTYMHESNLFLELNISYKGNRIQKQNPLDLCGLKNVGNTCYMNSFLQSLYYIRNLRKQIIQKQSKDKFVISLQEVFVGLMQNNSSTIDPSEIIKTRSWSRGFHFQQQDIHQFKMQFFNQLETLDPKILELFQGESVSEVYCKDVEYCNKTKAIFNEIQLNITNNKMKVINNIKDSIEYIMHEESLEDDVQTEVHGLQKGFKKVTFTKLPNIIFFNLKRYQYNQSGLHKLLSKFQYQPEIDLSFAVSSREPQEYVLYSVLVHRGKSPTQGHYYTYINISTDTSQADWYKFNDSIVKKAERKQVIQDNFGGPEYKYKFDKIMQQFYQSHGNSITTAYILIYIKKDCFHALQNVDINIPEQIKLNVSQELEVRDPSLINVSVVSISEIYKKNFSIFDAETISQLGKQIILNSKKPMNTNIDSILRAAKQISGSVWKVSADRTIVNLQRLYGNKSISTRKMLLGDNFEKVLPQYYILVIPNLNGIQDNELARLAHQNRLALVVQYLSWIDGKDFISSLQSIDVVESNSKQKLEQLMSSDYDNKSVFQGKQSFLQIKEIKFKSKNMYCEVVQSFMEIQQQFYLRNR